MKNLPLGIQTFRDIIEFNNLYIDKTQDIYNLLSLNDKTYFFLSRPRRFGKSLFISTLEEIFLGNKELFKDLWIYDKYDFKKYPVIRFDFSKIDCLTPERLEKSLSINVLRAGKNYGIKLEKDYDYKNNFSILIEELSKKSYPNKVVILIDEYDKPIVDHIDNLKIIKEMKNILRNFYVTIKACDQYIKFFFLTGVSKFSKISVFSSLNNLTDLTLDERFSTMLGYTEKELFSYFKEHIKSTAKKLKVTQKELKEELKTWYNGYSWDGKNFLYNPFSILSVLSNQKINNYWFKSGTPTLLIKIIKEKEIDIEGLENFVASESLLDSFEIEDISFESLLFQTGYLTIKEIKNPNSPHRRYILNYPNMEVEESLLTNILTNISSYKNNEVKIDDLVEKIENNDLEGFFKIIKSIFVNIPNEIFMSDKERYYHTIIYLVLTLIGVRIKVEVQTNIGRIDAVIETTNSIYIIEFKMNSVNQALKQMEENKYHEKYLLENKSIYIVGVSFDSRIRNIKDWKVNQL